MSVDDTDSFNALMTVSHVSSYFFETFKISKGLNITIQESEAQVSMQVFDFSIFQLAVDTSKPLPLDMCPYIKYVSFEGESNEMYLSFNKMMSGPLKLECLSFGPYCEYADPSIIDSSCIVSIDDLFLRANVEYLTGMSSSALKSLKSVHVNCRDNEALEDFLATCIFDTEVKLTLGCIIDDETLAISVPVHKLDLCIYCRPSLDCFKSYANTLTSLDIKHNDYEYGQGTYNIDAFLSGATKLQMLSITSTVFDRTSLLATLHVVQDLKDLNRVSFHHNIDKVVLWKLLFFFHEQKLTRIQYVDNGFPPEHNDSRWLREELFDMATFTVMNVFIENVFGVKGGVPLDFFRGGMLIESRAEFDCSVEESRGRGEGEEEERFYGEELHGDMEGEEAEEEEMSFGGEVSGEEEA